jgi:ATP-dependent helicase/DNAse subunit B
VLTFLQFAEEVIRVNDPAARPLCQAHRRLLADDVVADLHARGQLAHFSGIIDTLGFGDTIFELLAELKQNEIWPAAMTGAVASLTAERRDRPGPMSRLYQCSRIYAEYQGQLIQNQLYDLEGRFWYARDLLERGQRRTFELVRAVFVDGFTDFTRTQHEILEALAGWVEELWVALPDEPGCEREELFSRPRATRQWLERLHPQIEELRRRPDARPAGLAHLEQQLFRPVRAVEPGANGEGVACIEAPGLVGEARRVARRIKELLLAGVPPDGILVTMRDLSPYADLLGEVFDEYGIPIDIEGIEPLLRNPAVATLLRALRLPEEDWPFAAVTALLRSGYFAPEWPETGANPEMPQHAEALLRLLREARGREAYLKAVRRWAEQVQPGLEDEEAEESRRQRTHQLARKCRDFLERFFRAWDGAPGRAPLVEHATWLRQFVDDIGLSRAARGRDAAVLDRFWQELDGWMALEPQLPGRPHLRDRGQFQRLLATLAAEAGLARTPRGPGRVRVLSAELARHLSPDYVFLMGLGERSFPRLAAPVPFLDESERLALKQAGIDLPSAADLMPGEMLLFYQVVTRARRGVVLSYPAVDDKGQELLPCSFLAAVRDCFAPEAIETERRRMLLEGLDRDVPLSAAEYRVRVAGHLARQGRLWASPERERPGSLASPERQRPEAPPFADAPGSSDLFANLTAALDLARQRFHGTEFTPYDGMFRDPAVIADVQQRFGPRQVFSPTALENYITCPFRFFLGHVLRLQSLEEPREDIEATDRGLAFHRALARLHRHLRERGVHLPEATVDGHMQERLAEAVEEAARRAASEASEKLWRLEGQRLARAAQKYRAHWEQFVKPWLPRGVQPQPAYFEVSFGLPAAAGETPFGPLVIEVDGIEVRISGRIDRVDVADLPDGPGFWIIDYKTGRSTYYTGSDLREFRRLQLTLYALAVEEVLLAGRRARPLGLAYWLVADSGPKVALPGHPRHLAWLEEGKGWQTIRAELRRLVARLVAHIRQGAFPLKPRSKDCTQTCDFSQVCRIGQSRPTVERKTWQLPLPQVR